MKKIRSIKSLRLQISRLKGKGLTVGFVPTMGNLHEGHLSLLKKCAAECDVSVLSIYVNPTQFGPSEDYGRYPRTLKSDLALAKGCNCDIVFLPDNETVYPKGFSTYVMEESVSKPLCGALRPGHFKGVATVVLKLFNIVGPDVAYLGQKDAQQALLIKKMVKDLDVEIKIRVLPIVREKNGLAMSSRNSYLTTGQREEASAIFAGLKKAQELFKGGERKSSTIIDAAAKTIQSSSGMRLDYVEIRSIPDLSLVETIKGKALLAVRVSVGEIHLIDNIVLGGQTV